VAFDVTYDPAPAAALGRFETGADSLLLELARR
jgi:hypothetical protein